METLNNSHGILLDFSHLSRRGGNRNSTISGFPGSPECHLSRRGVNRNYLYLKKHADNSTVTSHAEVWMETPYGYWLPFLYQGHLSRRGVNGNEPRKGKRSCPFSHLSRRGVNWNPMQHISKPERSADVTSHAEVWMETLGRIQHEYGASRHLSRRGGNRNIWLIRWSWVRNSHLSRRGGNRNFPDRVPPITIVSPLAQRCEWKQKTYLNCRLCNVTSHSEVWTETLASLVYLYDKGVTSRAEVWMETYFVLW